MELEFYIISNPNITMDIIENNSDKPWGLVCVYHVIQILQWIIIEKYSDKHLELV